MKKSAQNHCFLCTKIATQNQTQIANPPKITTHNQAQIAKEKAEEERVKEKEWERVFREIKSLEFVKVGGAMG